MNSLQIGAAGRFEHLVEDKHCTQRGEHKIFSTPNMVQLLEWAAIEALRPHLDETEISVGTRVDVKHLAPTPVGKYVRAEAVVSELDGARVAFDISVFDEQEQIGSAIHERFVLDRDRYLRRLDKKIAAGTP